MSVRLPLVGAPGELQRLASELSRLGLEQAQMAQEAASRRS